MGPVIGDTDKKRTSLRRLAVTFVLFIVREPYGSSLARHTKWPTKAAVEECFEEGDHTKHTAERAHSVLFRREGVDSADCKAGEGCLHHSASEVY